MPRLLVIALLVLSCGPNAKQQAIAAGATAAAAVAVAAINRAATDECWGNCSNGYVCDHQTGECVLPPETDPGKAAQQAANDDGCIEEDDGRVVCPEDPPAGSAAPNAAGENPCHGLCFGNEVCVLDGGVADCAPGPR